MMEEIIEEIVLSPIKEEELLEYPPSSPIELIQTNPLDASVPPEDHLQILNRYCRLCLREGGTHAESPTELVPLVSSSVNSVPVPDLVLAVTGISVRANDDAGLPGRVCMPCLTRLDQAYCIRRDFVESNRILRSFVRSRDVTVVEGLEAYQRGSMVGGGDAEEKFEVDQLEEHLEEEDVIEEDAELAVESDEEEEVLESDEQPERKRRRNGRYNIEMKETKLDPNKCYICEEVFEDAVQLNVHLPQHVAMIPYSCEQCEAEGGDRKKLTSLILLHRHFRMHASSIRCPQCPFRTCTAAGLYNHMKNHSDVIDGLEYTCSVCGLQTKSKRSFDNHMRNHKAVDEGRYQCQYCEKKFGTNSRLIRHERGHTNERPYRCRYCTKDFTNETSLNAHERTHTGERGYRCELCDKAYRTGTSLKEHVAAVHSVPATSKPKRPHDKSSKSTLFAEPASCDVEGCSFATKSRAKFYNHKARHDLRFHCAHCSERFPSRQRLDQHTFVHTGVKPFCCEQCGKSFRFRASFNEHLDSHSNVRPYACEQCPMAFVRERTLKEHRLKHTDEKNYECRHCGKKFKYRADQSKHERTHADELTRVEACD
ncbi:zinc finger protein ZFP2-like [Culex pipiens pallens]|uniref:zinc finger protein ZFP2-like n=1 Tax=Culex pipiens pallens TaxID=42434 RepID=UPI001953A9E5|nr:zinc finger protein ZFP2-like [Culex pipiens pallens]